MIVISGEEHTDDKADLCDRALERMGVNERGGSLLVDNIESNVVSWRSRGGRAYWYRGDQAFAHGLTARGWQGLVSAGIA